MSIDLFHPLVLLYCGAAILFVGILDDMCGVPAKFKLIALVGAAGILVQHGCLLPLKLFGLEWSHAPSYLAPILTLVWILAVTVSVNFIDGLDGLAAGVVAIAAGVTAIGASFRGDLVGASLSLALLGSLTGFLLFNFNPARIFMGDGGSMFIGFILAAISTQTVHQSGDCSALMPTLLALSIPLLDTALTLLRRRILMRRSLFAAERGHVHHRLLDLGLDHRAAVLTVYCVTGVAACGGLIALFKSIEAASVAGFATILFVIAFLRRVGATRARETWAALTSNYGLHCERKFYNEAFEQMQLRLAKARTFDQWWSETCTAADLLHFAEMELLLPNRDGSLRTLTWQSTQESLADRSMLQVAVPVQQRRQNCSPLIISARVVTARGLEHAGVRFVMFLRLMSERGVKHLDDAPTPSTLPPERRPAHGSNSGTPELVWQVAEQS
jgi:UDP-N-acetylmuramyl pentapeptide phosphotransferase/UDP-N-acetylglucosamine-1-phosphate transferase